MLGNDGFFVPTKSCNLQFKPGGTGSWIIKCQLLGFKTFEIRQYLEYIANTGLAI